MTNDRARLSKCEGMATSILGLGSPKVSVWLLDPSYSQCLGVKEAVQTNDMSESVNSTCCEDLKKETTLKPVKSIFV